MDNEQNTFENMPLSYIGRQCYYTDKVTFTKKLDGRELGICLSESIHKLYNLPICWFAKPFLGFTWIYKSEINCSK